MLGHSSVVWAGRLIGRMTELANQTVGPQRYWWRGVLRLVLRDEYMLNEKKGGTFQESGSVEVRA